MLREKLLIGIILEILLTFNHGSVNYMHIPLCCSFTAAASSLNFMFKIILQFAILEPNNVPHPTNPQQDEQLSTS
jgi:hypothetical protein